MSESREPQPTESISPGSSPKQIQERFRAGIQLTHPERVGPYRNLEALGKGGRGKQRSLTEAA